LARHVIAADATQAVCSIRDETQIGAARRRARQMAEAVPLGEVLTANVGIVATELASNMFKHAGGGDLYIQHIADEEFNGLELLAVDRGPGVRDVSLALQDGHSTSGTPGTGLGAARRLSGVFDLHSEPGKGTVVLSRIGTERAQHVVTPAWGSIATSAPGETVSGDQWSMMCREGVLHVVMVDALGHGVLAHEAARTAIQTFTEHGADQPGAFLRRAHETLRSRRGAAIAVARCDLGRGTLTYAGIGNVAAVIIRMDGRQHGLVSHNGTVGADSISVKEFAYEWMPGEKLVMHTDGLRTRWILQERPGLTARHPAVIAAVLHRDCLRGKDDATVLVMAREDSAP
jgi:anti-sigma regulatory factor (Ser/Thr protein kinase)